MQPESVPTLDCKGLRCPLPVLKARKRLSAMRPGERLLVETTDPLAGIDIPALVREDGHLLLEAIRNSEGHRFLVERGPAAQRGE